MYRPGYFGEFYELTITRAPGPPDAPHLNVSPHDNGALAVSWEAPARDGGSEITGYRVQWKEAAGSWDTPADVSETTVTGTTHTITGLTDGVHYTIRVIAVNDLGDSDPSLEATVTPRETDPPGLSTATVDGVTLTLTYDEALDEGSLAEAGAFTVTVGGAARAVDAVSIVGNALTLTLASAVAVGEEVMVSYTAPADESTAHIRDLAGNAAPSFSGQAAANDTQAPATLTASVHAAPDSHDGETAFTFELKFSEEPHPGFSYATLRDHAFTVAGGSLSRVRRLAPPGNVRWEITIIPSSDEAVKVALPPTTDCDAQGAICTEDGRMMSEKVELTVEGPAEENTPATGAPTISGTVRVGETLTADTSDVSDSDGLTNAVFSYQWLADDAEIAGATNSTYTLQASDNGKTIRVKVSFTDDSGNSESLTSVATADVEAPLTAELRNVPESHNGQNGFTFRILFSEPVTVGYQGLKEDSFEISNETITRARRVNGRNDLRQFTVRPSSDLDVVIVLPADRPCDEEGAICTSDGKRLSNRLELTVPGPAPANALATGAPTISGTAQVGQTLTAATSNIADSDGLDNAVYGYQWVRNDGGTDAEIQGATGSTYTLDAAAEGKTVKVRVSFTDDGGNEESLTSRAPISAPILPEWKGLAMLQRRYLYHH